MLRGIAPALLILVGLVLGTDARGASVPAFFWSGRRVFVGGKANALEAATPRSLVNVIERMAGSPSAAAASPMSWLDTGRSESIAQRNRPGC